MRNYRIILTSILFLQSISIFAQPNPPEGVPVDGGLSILMGAGVLYGAKKAWENHRNNKDS